MAFNNPPLLGSYKDQLRALARELDEESDPLLVPGSGDIHDWCVAQDLRAMAAMLDGLSDDEARKALCRELRRRSAEAGEIPWTGNCPALVDNASVRAAMHAYTMLEYDWLSCDDPAGLLAQ